MATNANAPGLARYLPDGTLDEDDLVQATHSTLMCLHAPDRSSAEKDAIVLASLDDPRVKDRIDSTGRELVVKTCAVEHRYQGCLAFLAEAEAKLDHERREMKKSAAAVRRHEHKPGAEGAHFEAATQHAVHSLRARRLDTIIEKARSVTVILSLYCREENIIRTNELFGCFPESIIETLRQPHGLETHRRRMEYADKVVARLHEDFPGMMAELPSDLLLAEGPERQTGQAELGQLRTRGVMLKGPGPV